MNRIVLVTRYPEAGRVKTRLIPALGGTGAAEVHRLLTEKTVRTLHQLPADIAWDIYYTGGSVEAMRAWLGEDLQYIRSTCRPARTQTGTTGD